MALDFCCAIVSHHHPNPIPTSNIEWLKISHAWYMLFIIIVCCCNLILVTLPCFFLPQNQYVWQFIHVKYVQQHITNLS